MAQLVRDQFRAALLLLLKQKGWGAQASLADGCTIDRGYLNAIVKGRKAGSEEIRQAIAKFYGMTYDAMLAYGRKVLSEEKNGIDAGQGVVEERECPCPSGSDASGDGGNQNLALSPTGEKYCSVIARAIDLLGEDLCKDALINGLVDALSVSRKENEALMANLRDFEDRLRMLETRACPEPEPLKKIA